MRKKFINASIIIIILLSLSIFLIKPVFKKINYGLDLKGGFEVLYKVENLNGRDSVSSDMLKSTYKAIVGRIDTLGVSEPEITIEGSNIRIKLPGVKNEEEARERLSTPAVLTFRNTSDEELMNASILGNPGASIDYDSKTSKPVVALNIKDNKTFYNKTKEVSESDDKLIVIWLDFDNQKDSYESQKNECGKDGNMKCISAATVNEGFMNNVVIQGNFTEEEAQNLVDLINSGSLPTKLTELSTKTVDATFGVNIINNIKIAFIIALSLITLILVFKYRFSGLISSVCLLIYGVLVFIVFNQIGGVLTLPGIAAMILGIGMAVDSSIISIERIKDEVKNKKSLKESSKEGNKRSLVGIIDANATTLLAAVILFMFGESSVKGFATMLMITIVVTILIMVFLNRYLLSLFINSDFFNKRHNQFFGKNKEYKNFDFIKNAKYFIGGSLGIIIIGIIFFFINGFNLGLDFKGGSLITVKSEENIMEKDVEKSLKEYNINDVTKSNSEISYRIKNTLNKEQINSLKKELKDYSLDISVISSSVKKDLTKNAVISLIYSCIGIIIYACIRFNFNFSMSSIIALLHDVLIVISIFSIIPWEINFIFIAAILTIIGYSINDTIIVFDRIRENKKILYKNNIKNEKELINVVNTSSNETISRNIWTSITTICTLVVLMLMNISSLLSFNIALLIGLIAGSISSIFIAPYIYYLFERKNIGQTKKNKFEDELDEKVIKGINS